MTDNCKIQQYYNCRGVNGGGMEGIHPLHHFSRRVVLRRITPILKLGQCVCHTHQELLDSIDVHDILSDFSSRSEVRQKLFGRF